MGAVLMSAFHSNWHKPTTCVNTRITTAATTTIPTTTTTTPKQNLIRRHPGQHVPVPETRGEAGGAQKANGGGPPREADGRPRGAVDHQGPRRGSAALHGEVSGRMFFYGS